jgi:hypothetical protein
MKLVAVAVVVGCWTGSPPPTPAPVLPPPPVKPRPVGSAKVVVKKIAGGVIQLDGDRSAAMDDATRAMVSHCGEGNFMIVQEGEETIVGHVEAVWRVHYQCNSPEP